MIRFAKEEDVIVIWNIYKPYITDTTISFEYDVPQYDVFLERFRRISAKFPWIVYEEDGIIAGYVYAERAFERKAYEWSVDLAVYMHKNYYRKGIASKLYWCLELLLKEQGYINLYALVSGFNEKSKAFHEAIGYKEVAKFPKIGYKFGQWLDVIWYEKQLSAHEEEPKEPIGIEELSNETRKKILDSADRMKK